MYELYKFIIEKIESDEEYKGNTNITFFNNYLKRSENKKNILISLNLNIIPLKEFCLLGIMNSIKFFVNIFLGSKN